MVTARQRAAARRHLETQNESMSMPQFRSQAAENAWPCHCYRRAARIPAVCNVSRWMIYSAWWES